MRLPGGRLFGAGLTVLAVTSTLVGIAGVTPAYAGTITGVTWVPSSAAATATNVTWSITFNTASNLAKGTDTITVTGPVNTVFPTAQSDYQVTDGTTAVTAAPSVVSVANSNSVPSTTTITMPLTSQGGDQLTVQINGITNPAAGSQSVSVSTTTDTTAGTSASKVLAAPVAPTVNSFTTNTVAAAATKATWTIDLNTSATNGQLWSKFGTLTVSDPSLGAVFSTNPGDYTITDVTTGSSSPGQKATVVKNVSVDTVTITTGVPVGAGDEVVFQLRGVTNPAVSTTFASLGVSTSSDSVTAHPGAGSFAAAQSATYSKLSTSTVAVSATKTTWIANYTGSSSGGLWAGFGTITLTLTGATFSSSTGNYTVTDITNGATGQASKVSVAAGSATITTPVTINGGDPVRVQARGVTNPSSTGAVTTTLSTSSDPAAVAAAAKPTLAAAQALGGSPSFNTSTAAESATRVTWAFSGNASSSGKLWAGQGAFVIQLPVGFGGTLSSTPGDYQIIDSTNGLSGTSSGVTRTADNGITGQKAVITTPFTINSGDRFILRARNVTNPSGASAFSGISLGTTSDTAVNPTPGSGTNFVPNHALALFSAFTTSNGVGGATGATWTFHVTTSSTGELWSGYGQFIITAPTNGIAGKFSTAASSYTISYAGSTLFVSGVSVSAAAGTEKVVLTVPMLIRPNGAVTVVLKNVTNPASGTLFSTIGIASSSDTVVHPGAGSFS